jgi:hypothetical protein
MTMCEIEFHGSEGVITHFPEPYPASQAVPEWLKGMPMLSGDGPDQRTLKRCPPFLGAITAGYIIPAVSDIHFWCDAAGLLRVQEPQFVETHVHAQYAAAPFGDKTVVKFLNPWLVRTPPGYSTLFCSPFNRFDLPFSVLAGVVETDTFYREVNFPAISMMRPDSTFMIPKGTPLVQVIPIRREDWNSKTVPVDEARLIGTRQELRENRHAYKEKHWQKQNYR